MRRDMKYTTLEPVEIPPMVLTSKVTKDGFDSLVRDYLDPDTASKMCREAYAMRLPGMLCAYAIEQVAQDCKARHIKIGRATELYTAVVHYDAIRQVFEANEFEYRPGAYLDMLTLTLCCARQHDWEIRAGEPHDRRRRAIIRRKEGARPPHLFRGPVFFWGSGAFSF